MCAGVCVYVRALKLCGITPPTWIKRDRDKEAENANDVADDDADATVFACVYVCVCVCLCVRVCVCACVCFRTRAEAATEGAERLELQELLLLLLLHRASRAPT